MNVDPYQWPSDSQIPTWSIFHPDNRPHPSFNGVSHSGEPASHVDSTMPVQLAAPSSQLRLTVAHNKIPHGQHVETDVIMFDDYVEPPPVMTSYPHVAHWEYVEGPALRNNAVPVIISYAPEYSEDMEIDAEGPLIEFQPTNHYPPHFGAEAIPGNPIIFKGPGIDDIPYNPNEPYFNARPQVVPPDACANDGVIPYNPTEPYFNVGPQVGIAETHNPVANVYLPYNAPQAAADDHFGANANVFPTGNAQSPDNNRFVGPAQDELLPARNYVVRPPAFQEPIIPTVAREADRAELYEELFGDDEEEDEEEDEPVYAPVWGGGGPPWEPGGNEDDDELEIFTGM